MTKPVSKLVVRAAADLHGNLPDIEPCHVLLLPGDLVPLGVQGDNEASRAWLSGPFSEWLDRIPAEFVVATAGNHDFWALYGPPPAGLRWTYLQDDEATVAGIRCYGTPWTPTFGGWAFEAERSGLEVAFGLIPPGLDLLLAHGPPAGFGDRASRERLSYGSHERAYEHVGSGALLRALRRSQPKICCYGHVHEDGGYRQLLGDTLLANVSVLDERYRLVRAPAEFILPVA